MPALSILLLLGGGVPFLVDDPALRQQLWLGFLGVLGLVALDRLVDWIAKEVLLDRDTERGRRLATFALALAGTGGREPGHVTRLGRATVVTGVWHGRPFRLLCDPVSGLSWEIVAAANVVDLTLSRVPWLGRWGPVRARRGGTATAWRSPQAGRAEMLACELLREERLDVLELAGDLLRAEGRLETSALELPRLLAVIQVLGAVADLIAPRSAIAAPAETPAPEIGLRCPWCHDALRGAATWECPACKTPHHAACVREGRGCTVMGCARRSARRSTAVMRKE